MISNTVYPVKGGLEDFSYGYGWEYQYNQSAYKNK